jgi:hypothetical protein
MTLETQPSAPRPRAPGPAGGLQESGSDVENNARSALLGSALVLVVGLLMVGVGRPTEGALAVVVGLGLTILSIHFYGRLGPDEAASEDRAAVLRDLGRARIWRGGLVIAVGAAATWGAPAGVDGTERTLLLAVAVVWGLVQIHRGRRMLAADASAPPAAPRRRKPKVEKRRRMDKSPAP